MMKTYRYFTFLLLLTAWLGSYDAHAQTALVRGKITDEATGDVLPGASVKLSGSNKGAVTNLQGVYALELVPTGAQTVTISYLGYTTIERSLDVKPGVNVLNVSLKADSKSLNEVTVKASLEGQNRALNQQRNADNITNIVSADVMSRFPDLDASESLQRVPGVNITRNRGQGGQIQLRGTPPNFTTVSINGEQIQGTERDNGASQRGESLDLIPADQLSSMEVSKAITPDQDGDAVGGIVNLVTPTAKSLKARGKVEAGGGFNDLSGRGNFMGKVSVGKRFFANEKVDDGRLGILVGGSYMGTDNGVDRVENDQGWRLRTFTNPTVQQRFGTNQLWTPDDYRYRYLRGQRRRTGVTATIDWKFSQTSKVYAQLMYSRLFDDDTQYRVRFDLTRGTWQTPDSITGTRVRRDLNVRTIDKTNLTYNIGGEHRIGRGTLDWGYFNTESRRYYVANRADFRRNTATLKLLNPYTDNAYFVARGNNVPNINDPAFYTSFNGVAIDDIEDNQGSNRVYRLNYKLPYTLGGNSGYLKIGGKYRTMRNEQLRSNKEYDFRGTDGATQFSQLRADQTVDNFLQGQVPFGPGPDPDKVRAFFEQNRNNPARFLFSQANSLPVSAGETYGATEDVLGLYALTRLQFKKLSVLAGLRYEGNDVTYNANLVSTPRSGTVIEVRPLADGLTYNFVLPNIHLRYALDRLTNIRAAFTQSYGRTNIGDLVPRTNLNILNNTLERGNPDLKPAFSNNFDLMFERYFQNIGLFSVGYFRKEINDFFFTRLEGGVTPAVIQQRYGLTVPDPVAVTSVYNGERATVSGLEVNLQANLDFLPGLLKGFNAFANYTYATSNAQTADRRDIRLQGQAEHTANGSLAYDYRGFTVRGSVNYNGAFTTVLAENADRDIINEGRTQIDLSAQYQYKKNWRLFTEFVNINNAPQVRFQGQRDRIMRVEYFGWWSRFGVAYQF